MASLFSVNGRLVAKNYGGLGLLLIAVYTAVLYLASSTHVVLPTSEICLYSNQAQDDLQKTFKEAILQAQKSITCIIYSLTDEEILQALKIQADRGIQTKVICDAVATQGIEPKLGKNVQLIPVRLKGLMHNKLLAIDDQQCWLGSCNFTRDSLLCHANLVLGINCPQIAQAILQKASFLQERKSSRLKPISLENPRFDFLFLPDDKKALDKVVNLLKGAEKSVKVAMFTFTHPVLIQSLIDLHRKGIKVQIVLDNDSSRKTSRIAYRRFSNEMMDVRCSMRTGLLHEKIAIIDDKILIGGSTNWTKAGFTSNDEHIFIMYDLTPTQKQKLDLFWKTTLREAKSNL